MKQNKAPRLSLQKTTISKLDSNQLNTVQGGSEAIANVFISIVVLAAYELGKQDGAKNKGK
jgi:hypothetical protein